MQAARNLERSTSDLAGLLRGPIEDQAAFVRTSNVATSLRELFAESKRLADTEPERRDRCRSEHGLGELFQPVAASLDEQLSALADLLETRVLPACRKLRNYNIDQVGVRTTKTPKSSSG